MARQSSLSLWLTFPWWFLTLLAAIVYAVGVYGLPNFPIEHPLLAGLASRMPSLAKPLSVALLVLSAGSAVRSMFMRLQRRKLLARQTGIESIRSLSWKKFEQLIGEAYRQQGYLVNENGGSGPDDGIDLTLTRAGKHTLVQCKHWRSNKIGVPIVREHLGVMTAHKADHGMIVSSGEFTAPAISFAVDNGIELIDGAALVKLLSHVRGETPSAKADKPPVPANHSQCPLCKADMVRRVARRGPQAGSTFMGCSTYPACRGTRDIRVA